MRDYEKAPLPSFMCAHFHKSSNNLNNADMKWSKYNTLTVKILAIPVKYNIRKHQSMCQQVKPRSTGYIKAIRTDLWALQWSKICGVYRCHMQVTGVKIRGRGHQDILTNIPRSNQNISQIHLEVKQHKACIVHRFGNLSNEKGFWKTIPKKGTHLFNTQQSIKSKHSKV